MTIEQSVGAREFEPASTGELFARMSEQLQTLVKAELAMARSDLSEKGKHAAAGTGLLAGAGVLAWFVVGLLLTAGVGALSLVWPVWLAALAVALAVSLVAGLLALLGRGQLRQATPLLPAETVASIKEDISAVRDAIAEGRRL